MEEKGIINGKVIKDKTVTMDKLNTEDYIVNTDDGKSLVTLEYLNYVLSQLRQ